jgi:hypothetical protein
MGHRRSDISRTTIDDSWRREAAAFTVVQIIRRDQPEEFEELRARVCAGLEVREGVELPEEKFQLVADWCAARQLSSDWVRLAAVQLTLFPNDKPLGRLTIVVLTDDDGEPRDENYLPWYPTDSKNA